jgi:hypothetical protein
MSFRASPVLKEQRPARKHSATGENRLFQLAVGGSLIGTPRRKFARREPAASAIILGAMDRKLRRRSKGSGLGVIFGAL